MYTWARPARRDVLRGLTGAAFGALASSCRRDRAGERRPNILFLMCDQLRWDALGANGGRIASTPNLDALAARAVNFRQAICAAPLCGPSRAGILTGSLMRRHGCEYNQQADGVNVIRPEVLTFDELLHAAGYHCEYLGKWHTGAGHQEPYAVPPGDFLAQYRDEMLAKHGRPKDPKSGDWLVDSYTDLPYRPFPADRAMRSAMNAGDLLLHRPELGESYLPAEDSLTAWTAQRVMRALRAGPPQPFCITGSFLAPHSPLIATKPYSSMFDPRSIPLPANLADELAVDPELRIVPRVLSATPEGLGQLAAVYYGLVVELDHWMGEVLRTLGELGLDENTLVVFTSDHGEMLGSHGMLAKTVFFEEALRVPLLVRAPGGTAAASSTSVTGRDLFATLLEYAGLPLPEGALATRGLRATIEHGAALGGPAVSELNSAKGRYYAVREPGWKLMPIGKRWQLFDLAADPGETRGLLGDSGGDGRARERARALRQELVSYLSAHGDGEGAARVPGIP